MNKIFLTVALLISVLNTSAQVSGDTPDQRLYLLCKTWGYVKYFHQEKCNIQWDNVLNNSINQVLASATNPEFNKAMFDMLIGIGNHGPITAPGVLPDTNLLVKTDWTRDPRFSQPVKDFLTTFTSRVSPSRTTCFVRPNNNAVGAYGLIDFTRDTIKIPIDYTVESNRLTVLFYYWNVINYFFPYRELMDQSWDKTLEEFIPVMRAPQTKVQFHTNFLRLSSHINDSHSSTGSLLLTDSFWKGTYQPKIHFGRIEDQCVVTKVDGISEMEKGDILRAIDDIDVGVIEDSLEQYLPGSNPSAKYRNIYDYMLLGAANSKVTLTLLNQRNQPYKIEVWRDVPVTDWYAWKNDSGNKTSYHITACDYGYVDMGRLQPAEVPAMYAALKSTPAIIFDIRNYPNGTLWNIAPLLFHSPVATALFYRPALTRGSGFDSMYYFPGWFYINTDIGNLGTWTNPDAYTGDVYLLVNQETQSHAEYTCQYLSFHPNAKVIGSQTAGADGNVSRISLPGGIKSFFTSLGWYYSDGYQQQRNGVKIDSIVTPTIQGLRNRQDEVLLAALKCMTGTESRELNRLALKVFPNPAKTGNITVSLSTDISSEIELFLMDLTGRIITTKTVYCPAGTQSILMEMQKVPSGVYLLKAQSKHESVYSKLIIQ